MKKDTTDFKGLDKATLEKKVSELRLEIFKLGLQRNTSGLEKSHVFQKTKRDIARLLTVLNEKK
ncbi:MAG: 50S ribosomal protein L29 [Bacteriovoracaceae bacterium]|nr:50S ribosomal protein L29 [Bacteriovoracaceae bacterium]